jgi:hypothetical protein
MSTIVRRLCGIVQNETPDLKALARQTRILPSPLRNSLSPEQNMAEGFYGEAFGSL